MEGARDRHRDVRMLPVASGLWMVETILGMYALFNGSQAWPWPPPFLSMRNLFPWRRTNRKLPRLAPSRSRAPGGGHDRRATAHQPVCPPLPSRVRADLMNQNQGWVCIIGVADK